MVDLSPAELRARFESGLDDAGLQDVIDAERSVIESRFGPDQQMVETFDHRSTTAHWTHWDRSQPEHLVLRRPAASIVSVVEQVGETTQVLTADDYTIVKRYQLRRLSSGTRWRWGNAVIVTYVPEDDSALRKQVLIRLCQLNLAENGYLITKTPEFTLQAVEDFGKLRHQALRRLKTGSLV